MNFILSQGLSDLPVLVSQQKSLATRIGGGTYIYSSLNNEEDKLIDGSSFSCISSPVYSIKTGLTSSIGKAISYCGYVKNGEVFIIGEDSLVKFASYYTGSRASVYSILSSSVIIDCGPYSDNLQDLVLENYSQIYSSEKIDNDGLSLFPFNLTLSRLQVINARDFSIPDFPSMTDLSFKMTSGSSCFSRQLVNNFSEIKSISRKTLNVIEVEINKDFELFLLENFNEKRFRVLLPPVVSLIESSVKDISIKFPTISDRGDSLPAVIFTVDKEIYKKRSHYKIMIKNNNEVVCSGDSDGTYLNNIDGLTTVNPFTFMYNDGTVLKQIPKVSQVYSSEIGTGGTSGQVLITALVNSRVSKELSKIKEIEIEIYSKNGILKGGI